MKTLLLLALVLFGAIISILVLGGVFEGVWNAVGLLPRWVWIIVFLLFVVLYLFNRREENISDSENTPTNREDSGAAPSSSSKDPFEEAVKHMRSPVRIVAFLGMDAAIVSPTGQTDKSSSTKQMARIQLIQEIRRSPALGSAAVTCRYAEIVGSIEELQIVATRNGWKVGTLLPGKILRIESFYPKWNGHQPVTNNDGDVKGITYLGDFYPIYECYEYTEDENARDRTFSIEDLIRRQG